MADAAKTVEVKSRPAVSGYGYIPEMIDDEFAAKGMHVFLASGTDNAVAQRSVRGAWPIETSELTEEAVTKARQSGYRVQPDGTLKRGDCILFAQTVDQREANREESKRMWAQQASSEAVYEQVEDMNQQIRKSPASGEVRADAVAEASDHVSNTKSLVQRLLREGD